MSLQGEYLKRQAARSEAANLGAQARVAQTQADAMRKEADRLDASASAPYGYRPHNLRAEAHRLRAEAQDLVDGALVLASQAARIVTNANAQWRKSISDPRIMRVKTKYQTRKGQPSNDQYDLPGLPRLENRIQ